MVMQIQAKLTAVQYAALRTELVTRWPGFGKSLQSLNDWPHGLLRINAVRGGFPDTLTIDAVKRLVAQIVDAMPADTGRLSPLWADKGMQRVALRQGR